jgi:hypothetical protein
VKNLFEGGGAESVFGPVCARWVATLLKAILVETDQLGPASSDRSCAVDVCGYDGGIDTRIW